MTIGDVLAVVAFLGGAGLSWWALLIISALLWPNVAAEGCAQIESRIWRTLGIGVAVTLGGGLLTTLLANLPNGLLKLLGWVLFMAMLVVAAFGSGSLAVLGAKRLQRDCPQLSQLGALSRSSALLVGAQFVPLLGWLVLIPLTFLLSIGVGSHALWSRRATRRVPVVAPAFELPQLEVSQ